MGLKRALLYRLIYPCQALGYSLFHGIGRWSGVEWLFKRSERQWNAFYHAFELHFRGDSLSISARLWERYSNKIARLAAQCAAASSAGAVALDLGCGNGEFLDLCRSHGFTTRGVDLSPPALATCRGKGHQVYEKDILTYLRSLSEASITLIGMFHVIEHCSPRYMFSVMYEISRVLRSGGMCIVETPSLFSLWSSVRQFYLDPTHLRPVHPDYMVFLLEHHQLYLEETLHAAEVTHALCPSWQELSSTLPEKSQAHFKKLQDWLYGPMDIAVVARK